MFAMETEGVSAPTMEVSLAGDVPSIDGAVPSTPTPKPAPTATGPIWPSLSADHPLSKLQSKLSTVLSEASHAEIWGVHLSATAPIPFTTTLILQKFLRANADDVDKAAAQLSATLKWRREFDVRKAVEEEAFAEDVFGGLGYITVVDRKDGHGKEVVTWNIYGGVKDKKRTFGDLDRFLRWRVALMEKCLSHLNLPAATVPISDHGAGTDPYQRTQIHDYLNVSFLRMDPAVKTASQKTIALFQAHYPELLSRKFFVNVPYLMGWLFALMKTFMATETARKLTVLSDGKALAAELGEGVPVAYGGEGTALETSGGTVKLKEGEGSDAAEGGGVGGAEPSSATEK